MKPFVNLTGQKFGKWTVVGATKCPAFLKSTKHKYWAVICECGTESITTGSHLRFGKSKGCQKCAMKSFRKEKGHSSFILRYGIYRRTAQTRNLSFNLTHEEFKTLTQQDCFYCGAKPSMVSKSKTGYGEYIYNGIDRKDNTLGYSINNCVAACKTCNFAKNDLELDVFLNWVKSIYNHSLKGNDDAT